MKNRLTVTAYIPLDVRDQLMEMAEERNISLGELSADIIETVIEKQCLNEIVEYTPKNIKRGILNGPHLTISFTVNYVVYDLIKKLCEITKSSRRPIVSSLIMHNLEINIRPHRRARYSRYKTLDAKSPLAFWISSSDYEIINKLSKDLNITIPKVIIPILKGYNMEKINSLKFSVRSHDIDCKKLLTISLPLELKESFRKFADKQNRSLSLVCATILNYYFEIHTMEETLLSLKKFYTGGILWNT